MGMMKHLMHGAREAGAKSLMGAADAATGGLASKLTKSMIEGANKHAGVIGKVASDIGKSMFSDNFRKNLASVADKALEYIPAGNVKNALSKINDEAQGRKGTYAQSNSSPAPLMKPVHSGTFKSSRATQYHNWNNPSHSSSQNQGGEV